MKRYILILLLIIFLHYPKVYGVSNRIYTEDGTNYNDIREALDSVPPYTTIYIVGSFRDVNLVIDKPIRLIGAGYAELDGGLYGTIITINNTHNVYLENIIIKNSGRVYSTEDSGIKIINSHNISIVNVSIENTFFGILIKESNSISIWNSTIIGIKDFYLSDRMHGIYTWYSRRVSIINNFFEYTKDGVYNDHNYDTIILNNRFRYGRYGIHLMYSRNYTIENNTIEGYVAGMALMYSEDVVVRFNNIYFNRVGGIGEGIFIPETDNVLVEHNWVVGNVYGLNIRYIPYRPGKYAIIRYNVIAFNYIGISVDSDSSAYIYGNDFIENIQNIRYLGYRRGGTRWYNESIYMGNYWSDLVTYDLNDDGYIDIPYTSNDPLYQYFIHHKELSIFYYSPSYFILNIIFRYSFTSRLEGMVLDPYPSRNPINIRVLRYRVYMENIPYALGTSLISLIIYGYGVRYARGKRGRKGVQRIQSS